ASVPPVPPPPLPSFPTRRSSDLVTDESSVASAFQETAVAYGGLDIVVSNAGMAHSSPIDRLDLEDWRRSLEVNATGHFLVARARSEEHTSELQSRVELVCRLMLA